MIYTPPSKPPTPKVDPTTPLPPVVIPDISEYLKSIDWKVIDISVPPVISLSFPERPDASVPSTPSGEPEYVYTNPTYSSDFDIRTSVFSVTIPKPPVVSIDKFSVTPPKLPSFPESVSSLVWTYKTYALSILPQIRNMVSLAISGAESPSNDTFDLLDAMGIHDDGDTYHRLGLRYIERLIDDTMKGVFTVSNLSSSRIRAGIDSAINQVLSSIEQNKAQLEAEYGQEYVRLQMDSYNAELAKFESRQREFDGLAAYYIAQVEGNNQRLKAMRTYVQGLRQYEDIYGLAVQWYNSAVDVQKARIQLYQSNVDIYRSIIKSDSLNMETFNTFLNAYIDSLGDLSAIASWRAIVSDAQAKIARADNLDIMKEKTDVSLSSLSEERTALMAKYLADVQNVTSKRDALIGYSSLLDSSSLLAEDAAFDAMRKEYVNYDLKSQSVSDNLSVVDVRINRQADQNRHQSKMSNKQDSVEVAQIEGYEKISKQKESISTTETSEEKGIIDLYAKAKVVMSMIESVGGS